MKRDLTVYIGSAWWRDCDPHTYVVALTAELAEKALEDAMRDAAERATDDFDDICGTCGAAMWEESHDALDCGLDAQAYSGVFPESLREVLSHDGRPGDLLADLRATGVAFPEVT